MEIYKIEDVIVPVGIRNMFLCSCVPLVASVSFVAERLCLKNICRALHKNESVANNQRLARNMELLFHFTLLS